MLELAALATIGVFLNLSIDLTASLSSPSLLLKRHVSMLKTHVLPFHGAIWCTSSQQDTAVKHALALG